MLYEALILAGAPVLRAVAGWLENSLEDGKISLFEWKELTKTIFRLGVPSFALAYGFELPIELSASIPIVIDYVFSWIGKVYRKNRAA
jgi:hypothetical protein